jgi:hypothetical protein
MLPGGQCEQGGAVVLVAAWASFLRIHSARIHHHVFGLPAAWEIIFWAKDFSHKIDIIHFPRASNIRAWDYIACQAFEVEIISAGRFSDEIFLGN